MWRHTFKLGLNFIWKRLVNVGYKVANHRVVKLKEQRRQLKLVLAGNPTEDRYLALSPVDSSVLR